MEIGGFAPNFLEYGGNIGQFSLGEPLAWGSKRGLSSGHQAGGGSQCKITAPPSLLGFPKCSFVFLWFSFDLTLQFQFYWKVFMTDFIMILEIFGGDLGGNLGEVWGEGPGRHSFSKNAILQ